jgi:hypothetical protein
VAISDMDNDYFFQSEIATLISYRLHRDSIMLAMTEIFGFGTPRTIPAPYFSIDMPPFTLLNLIS